MTERKLSRVAAGAVRDESSTDEALRRVAIGTALSLDRLQRSDGVMVARLGRFGCAKLIGPMGLGSNLTAFMMCPGSVGTL
jgi:hypothetical protein